MNDKELLSLLQSDPERGLEQVVKSYSAYVYAVCKGRLSAVCDERDMEEAASDIFVRFYRFGLKRGFNTLTAVRPVILVIARRRCTDIFRTKSGEAEAIDIDDLTYLTDGSKDTERAELIELIKALGEPDSRLIWLRYFYGLSSKEIGRQTGLRPNTVDKRIQRALSKLRQQLEEDM